MSDEATPTPAPEQAKPEPEQKAADTSGLQRNYQRALDEAKKVKEENKLLAARLAEALPYVEKLKGTEEAKELEARRQAEAAEKARSASERRERAIREEVDYALLSQGRKVDRRGVGLIRAGALIPDSGVVVDDEGKVQGVDDYLSSVFSTFAPEKAQEFPRKTAPLTPDRGTSPASPVKKYTTIAELDAEGPQAVLAYQLNHPEEYAALVAANTAALLKPRRQTMPMPVAPQR